LLDDFYSGLFDAWDTSINSTLGNWTGTTAIELELVNCNDRTVLLGIESDLKEAMNYLKRNYVKKDFYINEYIVIDVKLLGWTVLPEKFTFFHKRLCM